MSIAARSRPPTRRPAMPARATAAARVAEARAMQAAATPGTQAAVQRGSRMSLPVAPVLPRLKRVLAGKRPAWPVAAASRVPQVPPAGPEERVLRVAPAGAAERAARVLPAEVAERAPRAASA